MSVTDAEISLDASEQAPHCPVCGVRASEQDHSVAVGGVCCERCYVKAAPPISREARRFKPLEPKPPPENHEPYAELLALVWERIEEVTGMPVFLLPDAGCVAAYCPACLTGTLTIQFLDKPACWQVHSGLGFDRCSNGCTTAEIREAING